MNRIRILQILKSLILAYQNNTLTKDLYHAILKESMQISFQEEESYYETEFIGFLFKRFPYYLIFPSLNKITMTLQEIASEDKELKSTTSFICAILSEMSPNILARISTEVNVHITYLLQQFYQYNHLNKKTVISFLTKNSINPEQLVNMDTARSVHYKQEIIPGFAVQERDLREQISMQNYRKRYHIETKTQFLIHKYFDEKTLATFMDNLNDCLDEYEKEHGVEASFLREEYSFPLKEYYKKASKFWSREKVKEDDYQYCLLFH